MKSSVNPTQNLKPSQQKSYPWKGLLTVILLVSGSGILAGCGDKTATTPSPSPSSSTASESPVISPTTTASASPSPSSSTATASTGGGNRSLSPKKVEESLKGVYTQQAGVPIETVTCPDNVNLKAGGTFECKASAQNVDFRIAVTMKDNDGSFSSNTKGLLILTKLEKLLQDNIKKQTKQDVTADCGGTLRAAKVGDTFPCTIKDAQGKTQKIELIVKTEEGRIDVK